MNNKTLSIFVDESGILSEQDGSSRFYILTLVLHDQSLGIENQVKSLNRDLDSVGMQIFVSMLRPLFVPMAVSSS